MSRQLLIATKNQLLTAVKDSYLQLSWTVTYSWQRQLLKVVKSQLHTAVNYSYLQLSKLLLTVVEAVTYSC